MSHKLLSDSDVDNEKEIQDLIRILPTATDANLKRILEQAKSELQPLGMHVKPLDQPRPKKRKCPGPMDTDAHVLDNTGLFNNLVKATHRLNKLHNDSKKRRKVDQSVYCICKTPAASYGGEPMIQCDECQMWYHCECIGEDIQVLKEYNRWACKDCELGKSKTLDVSQFLGSSLLRKNNTGRLSKLSHLLIKQRHGEDWVNKFRVPSSLDSRLAQIENIKDCEEMTEDEIIAEMCRTHELMVQNNNELRDHIIKIATEKQRDEMDKEYEMRKRQLINTHALVIHEMEIKQRSMQAQLYQSKARYEKLDENTTKKITKLQTDLKLAEVGLKETRKELRKEKKKFSKDRQMWEGKFKETSKKSQNELQLRLREKKSLKLELEEKTEELNSLVSERTRLRKRCTDYEEDLKKKDEQLEVKSSKLQKQIGKNSALAKKFRLKSSEFDELEKKKKIAELSLDKKEKIEVKLKALQKRNKELVLFKKEAQVLKKEAERDERRYLSERKKLKEKISQLEKREQQRKNDNSRMSLQIKELELQIARQGQQRQSLPINCSTGRAVRNCPMSSKSLRAKIKVMKLSAKNLEKLALSQFGRGKFAPGTFDQWLNTKSSSSRLCVNEDTLEDFIFGVICEKAGYNKCHPSAIELTTATSTVTKVEMVNKVNGSATTVVAPPSHKKRTPWTLSMETSCNKSSESTTRVVPKDRKPSISPSETLTSKKVKVPATPVVAPRSAVVQTTPVVAAQSTVARTPRISSKETSTPKPSPLKVKKIKPSPGEVTVVLLNKKRTTTGVTYSLRDIIFKKHCLRHPVEPVETLKRSFRAPGKVSGAKIDAGKSSPSLKHSKNLTQKKNKNKRSLDDTAKLSQVSPSSKKRRVTSTPSPTNPSNGRRQSKRQGKSSTTSSPSSSKSSKKDENVCSKKDENVSAKKDESVSAKKDENVSAKKDENVSAKKDENISPKKVFSTKKVEDLSSAKGGNLPSKNEGNVSSKKEGNATSEKEGNVSSKKNGNVSSENVGNFSKKEGDIPSKKDGNVSSKKNGNFSSKKNRNFAPKRSGNVSSKKVRGFSSKKVKFSPTHRMTWQKTGVCGLCHFRNIPKVIDPEGRMLVCGGDMCPRPWWHRACLRPIPSKRFLKLNKRWYCPHCRKDYERVHMRKKSNPKERLAENLEPLLRDVQRWLKENPSYERDDQLR